MEAANGSSRRANTRKVNAVATSSVGGGTLTTGHVKGGETGIQSGPKEPRVLQQVCSKCNMFCGGAPVKCLYFEGEKFSIQKFMAQAKNRTRSKFNAQQRLKPKAWETLQYYYLQKNKIEDEKQIEEFKKALQSEAAKYTSPDEGGSGWIPAKGNVKTVNLATAKDIEGVTDWGSIIASNSALQTQLTNHITQEVKKQLTRDRSFGKARKKQKGGGGESSSSSDNSDSDMEEYGEEY